MNFPQPSDFLRLGADVSLAPHDEMLDGAALSHYFGSGMSAAWAIDNIIRCRSSVSNEPLADILDFGSGCGRVARFLCARFPDARLHVTDLRKDDAQWCADNLGCVLAPDTLPSEAYDLVWLGSVFTHLSETSARDLIRRLAHPLRNNGVLAFSTQGRFAYQMLQNVDWDLAAKHPWMSYMASIKMRSMTCCVSLNTLAMGTWTILNRMDTASV
jgi:trans-aconitate methyltransferase